ncbi:isochorismatase [Alphaproteobacteria bacterium]|nr:isochorismatase [Alphaproteobacteria bacterium]
MKNALLVIDVQNIYKNGGLAVESWSEVVGNINTLIAKTKSAGDLIVYIKHEHKADGSDAGRMFDYSGEAGDLEFVKGTRDADFIKELKMVDNAPVIVKNRYSSFVNTDLQKLLQSQGIEKLTICGFMTNMCCEATARHAHDLDYFIDFAASATGTPGTDDLSSAETIAATCATLGAGYAKIVDI